MNIPNKVRHIMTLKVEGKMKSWGSSTIKYKAELWIRIWPNKANVPFLSGLINKKDATSNEQVCEVDSDYVNLHDICTGQHSSFVIQS